MNQRILELALETLEARKAAIDKEIAEIQAELKGKAPRARMSLYQRRLHDRSIPYFNVALSSISAAAQSMNST